MNIAKKIHLKELKRKAKRKRLNKNRGWKTNKQVG